MLTMLAINITKDHLIWSIFSQLLVSPRFAMLRWGATSRAGCHWGDVNALAERDAVLHLSGDLFYLCVSCPNLFHLYIYPWKVVYHVKSACPMLSAHQIWGSLLQSMQWLRKWAAIRAFAQAVIDGVSHFILHEAVPSLAPAAGLRSCLPEESWRKWYRLIPC